MDVPIAVVEQIKTSELDLISYAEEGSQLVTNIHLANNNRENNRKEADKKKRDIRLKSVELESDVAYAKFMEISDQWPIILKKNDALEIYKHSEIQRKRGLDLIEQKNQMIETLKRDLIESDSRFVYEQAAQREDLRILQERFENQVKFMTKEYKKHIQYIKSTIDQEKEHKINKASERWKDLYNETILIESNSLDSRLALIEKKENNIMKQYEMNEETIRIIKSNMNTELHSIQREFELVKMKCIENIEKLNYNYQVLKRREEENACAKATQRRKINKLQDIVSTKRMILRETSAKFKTKVCLLQDEIEKLKQDIERHQKKAERFSEIHEKTYKELWDFSQIQITEHLEKIFKIDQIIYKTQLGINWHSPQKLKYLDVSELPSFRKNSNTLRKKTTSGQFTHKKKDGRNATSRNIDGCDTYLRIQNDQTNLDSYTKTRERALLQLIFDMTVKNASFILDKELIEIIKLHEKENLTLLYNAMAACGLNSVDSWKCILSYTQTMATCAVCCRPVLWQKDDKPVNVDSEWKAELANKSIDNLITFTENHTKYIEETLIANADDDIMLKKTYSNDCKTVFKQKSTQPNINTVVDIRGSRSFERPIIDSDDSTITFSLSLTDFEQFYSEIDSNPTMKSLRSLSHQDAEHFQMDSEEQYDFNDATTLKLNQNIQTENDSSFAQRLQLCDNPDHSLMIKDTDYLRVIKNSIDKKLKPSDQRIKNNYDFYLTNTLSIKDINDYWEQFLYAFPENRLKLWDILDKAIKKYYQILHMRFNKLNEVKKLETANLELKTILKQFMDSERNDVRLQNICTPKIIKQQVNSLKLNSKPTILADNFTNICGTSIHIFTVDRSKKTKTNRPFTAPMK